MLMRRAAVLFGLSERQMDQHGGSATYEIAEYVLRQPCTLGSMLRNMRANRLEVH
jgi:hypothetical protein